MFTGLSEFIAMHIIDLIGVPKRILRGKVKNSLADAAAVESAEKILIMVQYLYPDLRFLLCNYDQIYDQSPGAGPYSKRIRYPP